MGSKKFEIIYPDEVASRKNQLEEILKNAILLALLEEKLITLWQYEKCCEKLSLSNTINTNMLK